MFKVSRRAIGEVKMEGQDTKKGRVYKKKIVFREGASIHKYQKRKKKQEEH